ncbi:hypothetical protein CVT24_006860 [Panaeolus cyanescens]|uniref:Uncharacterized protein n=1 Tax=Panaeolus cyanescens TaxID=181874 RepID=A0A409X1K5_9AGAR|nr:hypothetical protein CVT24_006860 [Panaeolus cyanescens]
MGPDKSEIDKFSHYLKLKEDGTNWPAYKHEILSHLYSKGLRRHLSGRARPPEELVEHKGQTFRASDTDFKNPLDDKTIEEIEEYEDKWYKNEGLGNVILIATVPVSTYVQLRHYPNIAKRWEALCEIYEHRGEDVSFDLWDKFNGLHFSGGSVQSFISDMSDMRDQLTLNDSDLSDKQFVAAIRRAFRQSEYNEFLASVCAGIRNAGREITSNVLIQELKTEANSRHGASAISPNNKTSEALASSNPGSRSNNNKSGREKQEEISRLQNQTQVPLR